MRQLITLIFCLPLFACAQQIEQKSDSEKMILMSETHQKGGKYYQNGDSKPYNGVLYGKYNNGNYLTMQEYKDGMGNGYWIDFAPDGKKECQGTYINNRVEGPVTFYYEDGSVKSKGQYLHWKKPIGKWTYFDRKGNVVHEMTYTP